MSRHLRVTMPDGSAWTVPAEAVALRCGFTGEPGFPVEEAVERFIREGVLERYARSCPWSALAPHATMVSPPVPCDYSEGWRRATVEVREDE